MLGALNLAGNYGVIIEDIEYDIDDFVLFRFTSEKRKYRRKLHYDKLGNPYFKFYGRKFYLNEFVRI